MPRLQQFDEMALSYADLIRVVPDAAVTEIAANLLKDQGMTLDSVKPLHYTYGMLFLYDRDESPMVSLKLTQENARGTIVDEINECIDSEMLEQIENMDLERNEVAEKIGAIIIDSVNSDLPGISGFVQNLEETMGHDAWDNNSEDNMVMDDGGEGEWMLDNIANRITEIRDEIETPQPMPSHEELKKQNDLRRQYFYLAGIGKHLKNLLERHPISVAQYRRIIEYYNDAVKDTGMEEAYISWDRDWRGDFDCDVVKNIFKWMVNPISYLKDNLGIRINLVEYEKEHGKIPRQFDLPGIPRYKKPKKEGK